jgi:hypothetical protein
VVLEASCRDLILDPAHVNGGAVVCLAPIDFFLLLAKNKNVIFLSNLIIILLISI